MQLIACIDQRLESPRASFSCNQLFYTNNFKLLPITTIQLLSEEEVLVILDTEHFGQFLWEPPTITLFQQIPSSLVHNIHVCTKYDLQCLSWS